MPDTARNVLEGDRKNAANPPRGVIYRVANVVVEPGQARVERDGQPAELRPKTYRFLVFLLQNSNRLVTKEEFVDSVWDGAAVSDDVLVRSVAELRKLFGDDSKQPRILKTFPKLGYGLMAPVSVEPVADFEPAPAAAPSQRRIGVARKWLVAAGILAAAASFAGVWRTAHGPAETPYREVAWWKLDSVTAGIVDAGAGRHAGKLSGSPAAVAGKLGGAARFDSSGDYVSGQASSALPSGSAPRTLTAWVQLSSPRVDPAAIFEYGRPGRELSLERFFLGVGEEGFARFGTGVWGGGQLVGRTRLGDGEWHMLAGTYAGPAEQTARVYVDGVLDAEQKFSETPATPGQAQWRLGQHLAFANSFRGAIDDVRVFAHALDSAKVQALYRCSAGIRDLDEFYYLPVANGLAIEPNGAFRNDLADYAGVQLARPTRDCSLVSLRGANVAQDLRISVDLLTPSTGGYISGAGPYFRSRAAAPGDGILGGTSAGYWVELCSNGVIKVRRLNPLAVVAFTAGDPRFDASVYHRLEVEAHGEELTVRMDRTTVSFEQDGTRVDRVRIPPVWNGPPPTGRNDGAAGVLFGAEENRGKIGGQRAKNLRVDRP
jgi:DNA-binding winged helix-turn-helix (wHTH) protein